MLEFRIRHNQLMVLAGTLLYVPVGALVMWGSVWRTDVLWSYVFCSFLYFLAYAFGHKLKSVKLRAHLPMEFCFSVAFFHQFFLLHVTRMEPGYIVAALIMINAGMVVMGTLSLRHVRILIAIACLGLFSLLAIPTSFPVLALATGYLPLFIFSYITSKEQIEVFEQLEIQQLRTKLAFSTSKLTLVHWIDTANKEGQMIWDPFAANVFGWKQEPRTLAAFLNFQKNPQWTIDHFSSGRAGEVLTAKLEFVEDPSSSDSPTRIIQLEGSFVQEGRFKEWSGIAQDVTEASQLQAALTQERARSEASAKLVSLGEMAGGIAHEINNPMTIIQAMTEVLESTPVAPEAQAGFTASLNRIQKTVVRITRIVGALRMVSRDGTREPMKIAQLDALIEDSLSLCAEKFRSHGVEVVVDTTTSATIRCNAVQVAQVMVNLLNNAFDAIRMNPDRNPQKATPDKISLGMVLEGAWVKVTIQDTGPGVPEKIRARIFEPFFTTKPIGEGTGLGLSLSASIVKEHGGTMKLLETPLGQGAIFELSFPHATA